DQKAFAADQKAFAADQKATAADQKATAADQKATREDRPQAQYQRQKRRFDPPTTSQNPVFTGIWANLGKKSGRRSTIILPKSGYLSLFGTGKRSCDNQSRKTFYYGPY
ncbi:MAG TPA: hypothetical protein PKD11_16060, partial [Pyrinomonadaceae bacterium]|nr:hypothetical protein [Pyrinomonadaceae bacterium]